MQFPYAEVEIESTGAIHDDAQRRNALGLVAASGATDVLVLCHGWNNDIPQARRLYQRLTDNLAAVRPAVPGAASRTLAVVGALWPSIRWSDEDEVAGGGVGVEDEAAALIGAIATRIEDPARASLLTRLVPRLAESADARQRFLDALREQLPSAPPEPATDAASVDEDPPPPALLDGDEETVFQAMGGPEFDAGLPERTGGAADVGAGGAGEVAGGAADVSFGGAVGMAGGGAAGFGFDLDGVLAKARGVLNVTTYYTMKDRAGKVGSGGIATLLAGLAGAPQGVRLHLAGHSFGARALAAAAARHQRLHSYTLLQGAFSHHAFAVNFNGRGENGMFRTVLADRRLTGPMLVTHTVNDRAVGLAYAAASRLARQAGAGLGDANDPYGGIGRNGALKTPEAVQPGAELLDVGGGYQFQPGRVHNLRADRFVSSHGDVSGRQVAYALYCAIASQ
ncbi:hypothetical protein [Plantactinospora endophytica]|uniref:Alpha/beta hydrolase n=1 Tax=Plantactinospora endophytica TaxID=673535 RepID=A0ABQ4EBB6_9ACTN|nr:hypothetical protein [Plantactinospora endophytica]GIG92035.1 hypothetical protein Pen02_69710 [Plantactinospora endophytica]